MIKSKCIGFALIPWSC